MINRSEIMLAKQEMDHAWIHFNHANCDLVDSSIYNLKSAQDKYCALIKIAKREGILNDEKQIPLFNRFASIIASL